MKWTLTSMTLCTLLVILFGSPILAQDKDGKKYPTLLWEITGKGMKKPSYLFGTMHVSSKMVFHLSDSFYFGIRSSDVVALELDPQLWQDQLFRYQNMQSNLKSYTQGTPNDYLNEKSFQLERYENRLKAALSEEPTLINGLLYRTFQPSADFEEDTYLDLYIYQTGKKLGKQATGVENYFETERLILEATQDMMKDRKKKNPDADGETVYDIERKTQEAYRKGDLDMLDSLERIMQPSSAYMEKFLYKRNEIQANSIDSIIQKRSLFVGVGAAHLPGRRGVIELLRQKGYKVRPISMRDQDALQRDDIDKVKVPVRFSSYSSEDAAFSVKLPGKLYKRTDSRSGESWQYADMSNGAYYMITRIKTHGYMSGQHDETVLKKIDSLLYENVPGKILRKTLISRNGYKGYDVTNRTRRGDIQRYNIFETPFEILIFKMSGNAGYVDGKEADQFFGSIELKRNPAGNTWMDFEPSRGGFTVRFPQQPSISRNNSGFEAVPRWEFEANDSSTGDAYLVWRKTIQNYRFLEEDSFDLDLMEESFRMSDWIDKPLSRHFGEWSHHAGLETTYLLKDGSYAKARFLVNGPHYYMLAARSRTRDKNFSEFFDSFSFTPYRYSGFRNYVDSFVNIKVSTPIVPDIDVAVRNIIERASSEDFLNAVSDYNHFWPRNKTALFQDDSTGEAVYVSAQPYPKYFYPRDSLSFWENETNEKKIREDFVIRTKEGFRFSDSVYGVRYVLSDTNCSRIIQNWIFVKDNRLYRVISLSDSVAAQSEFIDRFYKSLRPLDKKTGESLFSNKLNIFFRDFYSKDSLASKKAKDAISNVYFGPSAVKSLLRAIETLPYNEKDYFSVKSRLINELGYIRDSMAIPEVVSGLKHIYESAGDTSTIQNAVFRALAKNKSQEAYRLLRTLLIKDPPVFDNASDYNYLFQDMADSLPLARDLFPNLLQLASVDDYKDNIRSLLAWLVDSSYLKSADYASSLDKILFDAKIQWKRQHVKDEKRLQKKDEELNSDSYENGEKEEDESNSLNDFAILLMPFYNNNREVADFFNKLLKSRDTSLLLNTAVLMIRNNQKVQNDLIQSLAASDQFRSNLYKSLEEILRVDQFPARYKNQQDITRSQLMSSRPGEEFYAIAFAGRTMVQYKHKKGWVYFYKYKAHKDDEWQMGISGLQPEDQSKVSSDDDLVKLTNKKLRPDLPQMQQFQDQLKRLLFSKHKSAASFYLDNDYYLGRGDDED